jgi:peptidoglycan/LPS O-acetylase OafA/YrhL
VPLLFASNWIALVYNAGALNAINPTWSLSVEEQFYLLWPLALWFAVRRRVRPLLVVGTLLVLCVALVAFADWLPWRYRWMSIYFNPFDRGAELLFGCMAALLWRYGYVPRILAWRPMGWFALGLLLLMAKHHQVEIHDYVNLAPWADIQAEYIFAAALAFVLVLGLVENPGGDLAVLFKFPPLRFIGKISYGIYLFHLPTVAIIRDVMPHHSDRLRGPLAIVVVVGLATVSWYGLEAPIQRWGKRSTARRRAQTAERRGAADSRPVPGADDTRPVEPAAQVPGEPAAQVAG